MEPPKLGIAIITFRRLERLKKVVQAVRNMTTGDFELVVADDGSGDGTAEWCRAQGLSLVTGDNRGVCWNKNRGLLALHALGCDPILLLEDDIQPVRLGWQEDWVQATARHHHLSFAHEKIAGQIISGTGTPEDPFVNRKATAQCTSVSARVMDEVGYLDTRFQGYGVGHAEWTTRIKRAGMGLKVVELQDGSKAKANLFIEGGLQALDAPSFRDNAQVQANRELFARIRNEPVYRLPWRTEEERSALLAELAAARITEVPVDVMHLPPAFEDTEAQQSHKRVTSRIVVNERAPKWAVQDLFAMSAMQPLAGGFVPWTSFSLRPSALQTVLNEIDAYRPGLIVECGAGASTVMICRLLRSKGYGGRLVSLEHDETWASYIAGVLESEELGGVGEVVLSPLIPWESSAPIESPDFEPAQRWYDLTDARLAIGDDPIGLLFVDGPPGSRLLARHPAVPELLDLLATDATVMLDDANRPAERETVRLWSEELGVPFNVYTRMALGVGRRAGGFTLLGC